MTQRLSGPSRAVPPQGVTNGDSHDHSGGDGAQIAYGSLSGLPTLGTAAATASTDYAPAAKGVTNGDSHDHNGGDGAQIAYSSLSGTPTLYNQTVEDEGTPITQRSTINFVGAGVSVADSGGKTTVTIGGGAADGLGPDGDKGDITVGGTGTTLTIDAGAVTYAKMQDVSAASRLLGRGSAAGSGDPEEISLGTGLSMSGTTVNAHAQSHAITSTSDHTAGNWKVLYTNGSGEVVELALGANGTYLQSSGASSAPAWATPSGTGDVTGPGSSTDNGIPRFDGTGGKTLQTSYATISDDGMVQTLLNSGACAAALPATCWMMLTADYTLANSGAEQKAFNTTTNGRLTLPTGVYEFECFLYLTTMSGTSGNLAFDPIGAGTAVTDRWGQHAYGIDNSTPLAVGARGGSASVTQQTPASAVTAGTGTGMVGTFSGMFRISTGGTIIPSVTLVTAAAAVVKAGSWFRVRKVGESSVTYLGAWD